MYIKRNIRKKINTPAVDTATSTTVVSKNISTTKTRTIKVPELGKYRFPTYEEVPSGNYFSIIAYARPVKTSDGKDAIEVFYNIKNALTCLRIARGLLPEDAENRWYYIRQRYPKFSRAYDALKDAMIKCLDLPAGQIPRLNSLPGLSEYITLGYESYSKIGGIKTRYPMSEEEFIARCYGTYENDTESQEDEEDYDNSSEENPVENCEGKHIEEYDNVDVDVDVDVDDDDDEFDNFDYLDDDE